ncbi:High-affinity branched-chain amino acid transport system permease protein LivH [Clostridiaceae bacterium JG1575]|nr:High-affinity branched-chain amino acid transport system permease protein LivH [Clostridiaceae bacterium JG1575]
MNAPQVLEWLAQNLVNALALGSLYALLAIGYTMVYGVLKLINFAHGDIFMMSTYFFFYAMTLFGLPWYLAFFVVILLTAFLGMTVEKVAYSPIREAPKVTLLISSIGASFLLEILATVFFGGIPRSIPQIPLFNEIMVLGPIRTQRLTFIIPLVTLVFLIILVYLIDKTRIGLAMRALSKDQETASLMGVNVNRTVSFTFAVGSGLAAVGGMLWGLKYPAITPLMGVLPGLKCFIAAVVGGIGSIKGAVYGGLIIGVGEIFIVGSSFLTGVDISGYKDAFAFVLLILILMFRPGGITGQKMTEKV